MTFFTYTDHETLFQDDFQMNCQTVINKMQDLHTSVRDKVRLNDWDLHPHWQKSQMISDVSSAADNEPENTLVVAYYRSQEQARLVENLMGIQNDDVQPYRHPVIEMRIAPQYFAIELVLSPYAWWDQQNFIGKFGLQRHRQALRHILQRMGGDYRFGFWGGECLHDMHLTSWQLLQGRVMDEWVDTFADGQDWLRFGVWYEPECIQLNRENIVHEAVQRIGDLYQLYDFLLWSSNNNYREFYNNREKFGHRKYA
jgi:hypothetical protein